MTLIESRYRELISGKRTDLLSDLARAALRVASYLYSLIMLLRNCWFSWMPRATRRVSCPVISIGNLSVGGTGKTPMTAKITNLLLDRGRRPAIILRGYRGGELRAGEMESRHSKLETQTSDEAMLLRRHCPEAVVLISPDRLSSAREAIRQQRDCIVMDDGFQHRRLARNLDIVLIDATQALAPEYAHILPLGLLREPYRSLRRAGLLILTRSDRIDEGGRTLLLEALRKASADKPVITAEHRILGFSDLRGAIVNVDSTEAMQAIIFAGIANFEGFRHSVEQQGIRVLAAYQYPDHHPYTTDEIAGLAQTAVNLEANIILTSEKDAVKLEGRWPERSCRVLALRLEIAMSEDAQRVLQEALEKALA
jgi:tetraacyldisaccharide 4'-kinase